MKNLMICLALCLSTSVNAGVIRSAVTATASSEFGIDADIGNTIDQSGLLTPYNSGITDFDTYLAGNPQHNPLYANKEWFTASGVTSAWAVFDLGAIFSLDAIALWVEEADAPDSNVSFLSSVDGVNFTSLLTGITFPDNPSGNYPATRYDFSAVDARYFRIDIGTCQGTFCALGEIAFSTGNATGTGGSVPVPGVIVLMLTGLVGFQLVSRQSLALATNI